MEPMLGFNILQLLTQKKKRCQNILFNAFLQSFLICGNIVGSCVTPDEFRQILIKIWDLMILFLCLTEDRKSYSFDNVSVSKWRPLLFWDELFRYIQYSYFY